MESGNRTRHEGRRTERIAWLSMLALAAALAMGSGCRRVSSAKAGSGDGRVSAGQVVKTYRSHLAAVQTTWEEKTSSFSGWSPRGTEGTGLVVASDGRTALVLTSRHMVDPRYRRGQSARTRGVMFHVRVVDDKGRGSWKEARLVAVYIHDVDLALLRIGAPSGQSFALPVARSADVRVGDGVIAIGPPASGGVVWAEGVLESIHDDPQLGVGAMRIRVTGGRAATAGVVFTRRGGRLVGVLRGQQEAPPGTIGDLLAVSADALRRPGYWTHLLDAGNTRRLLATIR